MLHHRTCCHAVQWFKAIDRDGNGSLDSTELQRALALGNLHFSLQATSHMIRCGSVPLSLALRAIPVNSPSVLNTTTVNEIEIEIEIEHAFS